METDGIGREEGQVAAAGGLRFPKGERLRRSEDIQGVLKRGRRYSAGGLQLIVLKGPETEAIRAGFIVKRKLGGAVRRNLMKRRMREAYRQAKHRVAGGQDLVVSATETMSYSEIDSKLQTLLTKAGVFKG